MQRSPLPMLLVLAMFFAAVLADRSGPAAASQAFLILAFLVGLSGGLYAGEYRVARKEYLGNQCERSE